MNKSSCFGSYGTVLLALGSLVACNPADDAAEQAVSPAITRPPLEGERFFSSVTQLTFGGQNAEAYFSSDGTQLIFQRQVTNEVCDQQYTMNIDGSGLRLVSNGLGRTTCGYFYQNDDRIVYSSTFRAGEECPVPPDQSQGYVWALFDYDIYTSTADGNDIQTLFQSPRYDAEATLSTDGSKMVFTSLRDGDLDIYTMNVDGSDVRRLTSTLGYDGGPFFSPDGSKIIYRAYHPETDEEIADYRRLLADDLVRPSTMEIFVMNADGTDQRQVTNLGGANFAPFFHPDGQRFLFSSNHAGGPRSRNFDIYMMNIDGTGLTPVATHEEFDGFPQFSPDGTKLVFASNRNGMEPGETNIFIADWIEPESE